MRDQFEPVPPKEQAKLERKPYCDECEDATESCWKCFGRGYREAQKAKKKLAS